jgi:hypothetical protein
VLLTVSNIAAYVWSIEVVHAILGSSCFVFDSSSWSRSSDDMSSFLVAAWASNPDFIPMEVGFSILGPVEPYVECEPPLFLSSLKIM